MRKLDLGVRVERWLKPATTGSIRIQQGEQAHHDATTVAVERWLCLLIAICWDVSRSSSREKSLLFKRKITGYLGLDKRQSQALINSGVQIRKAQRVICKKDTSASAITTALDGCGEYALTILFLVSTSRRVKSRVIRYVNDWKNRKPLLNGNDLKKMGLKPGPEFQKILTELRLAQIDGRISNHRQAKQFVRHPG